MSSITSQSKKINKSIVFRYVLHDLRKTMGMLGQKVYEKYNVSVGELWACSRTNVVAQGREAMSWIGVMWRG